MLKRRLLSTLFLTIYHAIVSAHSTQASDPLFAGTLLSIYAKNPKADHSAIQPYLFINEEYGFYNSAGKLIDEINIYRERLFIAFQTGITDQFAIGIFPNIVHSHSIKEDFLCYGDTILFLSFQLSNDQKKSWKPDCRLLVEESFPTGKYKNLGSSIGLDASGSGAYETAFILVIRKIFYNPLPRPFNFNLNLYYILSASTRVSGINVYGGSLRTHGRIHPGDQFLGNFALEYSISHNWGCGIDLHFEYQSASQFRLKEQNDNDLRRLSSWDRFSLAPCIEYNFNEKFNLITGMWFTVLGKNAAAFMGYGATVYYYF